MFTRALIGHTLVNIVRNWDRDGIVEVPALRTGALPAMHRPHGVTRDKKHIAVIEEAVPHPIRLKPTIPVSTKHPTVHAVAPISPLHMKLKHHVNGRRGTEHTKHINVNGSIIA
jgi:hypothetical protein